MTSPSYSSGLKTADGVIRASKGILTGVHLISDGTNDATLVIYDNASAGTGTEVFKITISGTDDSIPINLPNNGVYCTNGIYADITTAGTMSYIIYFR